jgi:hypothetical protein
MQYPSGRHTTRNTMGMRTMVLLLAALFTLCACATDSQTSSDAETISAVSASGSSSAAFKEGVPGGVIVDTVNVSAKVTAIDSANRKVTLLGPDGDEVTVKVGPEAINFDQVRVGDMVNATVTEELVVFLDEEGAAAPDGSAAMVALAPKGAQPGGVVAATTQVSATVKAIDQNNHTATLQFEDGSAGTFPVRDDIDLSNRKVGEKVVFQVTEMIAISVEKQ